MAKTSYRFFRKSKRLWGLGFIFLFSFLCVFGSISCDNDDSSDRYTALTLDDVDIQMRRYRPSEADEFNSDHQPILLFPGIVLNMNEFMTHTPDSRKCAYKSMTLPDDIAEWAEGDTYIEEDPMMYYSIAHYFWLKGYDPWFANYRGVGRGDYKSGKGSLLTNLDIWATLDTPACIDKVYEVTGMYPIIGGHSTGGLVSYAYLQGATIDVDMLGNGYIPHVTSDPDLAHERNRNIKGFIGLDPAGPVPIPLTNIIRNYPLYSVLGLPIFIDFDTIIGKLVNPLILDKSFLTIVVNMVFGTISAFADLLGDVLPEELDIFSAMDFWHVQNTHPFVEDYFVRFCSSSTYLRALSQYVDSGLVQRVREHWKNGEENKHQLMGSPVGSDGDDYYYYDEHMDLMTAPAICIFSESSSLVSTNVMVEMLMQGKTIHEEDRWYVAPGSAHADLPFGDNAPTFSFIKIGEWLDRVCPITP